MVGGHPTRHANARTAIPAATRLAFTPGLGPGEPVNSRHAALASPGNDMADGASNALAPGLNPVQFSKLVQPAYICLPSMKFSFAS